MEDRLTIHNYDGFFGRTDIGAPGAAHPPEASIQAALKVQCDGFTAGEFFGQGE
jgi:hypothetical protein